MEVECVLTRRDEKRHQAGVGRELNGGGLVVERGPPAGEVELVERDAECNRGGDRGPVVECVGIGDGELSLDGEAREVLRRLAPDERVRDGLVVWEAVGGDGQELAFSRGADGSGVALVFHGAGEGDFGELLAVARIPPR